MSLPREPSPVKLILGLLFSDFKIRDGALEVLCGRFGPLDFLTEAKPFTYTSYYDGEMGSDIVRQVGSFLDLVRPESLPEIKLFMNRLETEFSRDGKRRINLDPGLLSAERLVLATGKNFTHRIYLRDGIYADLTLMYQRGSYRKLPWTYPDYQDPLLLHFFGVLRQKLYFQHRGKLPNKQ